MARKAVSPPRARAFALVGHRSAGKTSLGELLLQTTRVVRTRGSVEEGTSLLDHTHEERVRKASTQPAFAWMAWRDEVLHLIDTPGGRSVAYPAELASRGADGRVVVVSATGGLERGAEAAIREAQNQDRPMTVVITKCDRASGCERLLDEVAALTGRPTLPLILPWFESGELVGLLDPLAPEGAEALRYADDGSGAHEAEAAPSSEAARLQEAREALFEAAADADDALLEAYLEYLELSPDQTWQGLSAAIGGGRVVPVLFASGPRGVGAVPLLEVLHRVLPDPSEWVLPPSDGPEPGFVAQWICRHIDGDGTPITVFRVWHGTAPQRGSWHHAGSGEVMKIRKLYRLRGPRRAVAKSTAAGELVAVWGEVPGQPGDVFTDGPRLPLTAAPPPPSMTWLELVSDPSVRRPALEAELERLRFVDPSWTWEEDPWTGAIRLAGTTRSQLHLVARRLREEGGLAVSERRPLVRYRERPRKAVEQVHGLHEREQGGLIVEFGECWIDVEPASPELGLQFTATVDDEILPRRFHAPVGEGIRRALTHGPTAGYPVSGAAVVLSGGEYNILESTSEHFEWAGELAMQAALVRSGTELLEPWSEVRVYVPADRVGPTLSALASARGRVLGMEVDGEHTVVQLHLPDRSLLTLSDTLDEVTGGRGWFLARPSHYELLPAELVGEAISSSPFLQSRSTAHAS